EVDPDWGAALGHSRSRIHSVPSHTGSELISLLGNAAERAGVDLITDAHVTDVFADESGAVRGVRFKRPDGSAEEAGCESLILTTCGFGANRKMVAKFIPTMKDATYFGHEGNEGEGIEFGMGLGAATADMTAFQGLGALADPHRVLIHYNIILRGGLIVNVK